jgi:3-hexulose-6-phosphate synthase
MATRVQVALDMTELPRALAVAEALAPWCEVIEAGTPLLYEHGLAAVAALKARCPERLILADLKIVDAGYLEASCAFRRGADLVTVLGVADDATIRGALQAAREAGGRLVADHLQVPDVVARARQLEALGVDLLCLHTAYDRKDSGADPLAELRLVRPQVQAELAVAGGLTAANAPAAAALGADLLVIGGYLTQHPEPAAAAAALRAVLQEVPRG